MLANRPSWLLQKVQVHVTEETQATDFLDTFGSFIVYVDFVDLLSVLPKAIVPPENTRQRPPACLRTGISGVLGCQDERRAGSARSTLPPASIPVMLHR